MNRDHEHPGVILAAVLKKKKINPLDLVECTQLSFDQITKILEGNEDIASLESVLTENCIDEDKPQQWSRRRATYKD